MLAYTSGGGLANLIAGGSFVRQ